MMKGKYVSEGMIFAADTDVDGGCAIAFFPDSTPPVRASTKAALMQKSKLDQFFSIPAAAVLMAVVCNVLWGRRSPSSSWVTACLRIDSADTASILCFAGVRFMMGAALVWLAGLALNRRPPPMPRGKALASACGLGLWQTAAQYFFYYSAVALLTGAMGGILNSTQSFMGVILAHFCTARPTG